MHIQEGTNTTLTTCTKMTEEVDRRYGVNGNSSSKGANEDAPLQNSALAATGGRLKFFKDGKFILELVRGCAREGERAGWVSVPRKTFWPPAAAPPTPPAGAPPSASLSVSDDNSSVQSSPWQRDHCWKQAAPRRNISKELAMYYCRPSTLHTSAIDAASRLKRRRPYDITHLEGQLNGGAARRPLANGICEKKRNGDVGSPETRGEDTVDGVPTKPKSNADDDRWTDYDREKYYHMKLKKPYQYRKLRVYKKTRPALRRKELTRTINKLRERLPALPAPINAKLASCRQEHMMVSPRKRILRELERVSLEDQSTKRRAKTVPALSTASYPPSPGPSHTAPKPPAETPRAHNGTAPRKETPVSKNVSSYSIHSLLSMSDESPTRRSPEAKRSPHSHPPSLKTESPSSVNSPDLSPSPDGYRYRYSALVGSPGQGGPSRDSPTPPHELARYRAPYAAAGSPYARAGQWNPSAGVGAVGAGAYRGSPARDEWAREVPYVYGYGYMQPQLYRAPTPMWMHYAVPPSPWAPLALPLITDHIPKDEPTSDLPLNLSKH
ncbi:hypothetical protein O3G_MSEX010426 [Manduca sexta]|uniref:Protein hairless n=1 Tax=Manduca sexta TaxID=7130 RepID=A0A921ZIJ2_MANSE|nr:hypothetical protein O3G_MSEX010426 [Manduca sexta]